jgi:hypothetical protein
MSTNTQAYGGVSPLPRKLRKGYWSRMGGKFLVLSIMAHLLFFTGAAYYIIQFITPKKLTFKAGVPSINPAKKLAEHKMSMAKKRKSMSAPAPAKRVVTTGLSKIILPPMPEMPTNVVTPSQITGIGGLGIGFGNGNGGNGNGDGGGGGFMAPFGTTNSRPGTLVGTFYDLKFLRGGQPAPDVNKNYADDITKFVQGGWHDSTLNKYLKGSHPLYTTQIFFPIINTNEAPKAFGSPKPDSPGKWCAIYKGNVSPPESGVYHFVAAGDDDMIIRFDNQTVLFNCEHIPSPEGDLTNTRNTKTLGVEPLYDYQQPLKFARSLPLTLDASRYYSIEILIGDDVPQKMWAKVLWEKEGVNYEKAGDSPILPVFALDKVSVAPETESPAMPHLDGPLWKARAASNSLLDMLDNPGP